MKNITLAIEEEALRGARVYAAQKRTTLNALVRQFLGDLASKAEDPEVAKARRAEIRRQISELSKRSTLDLGPDWKWNRDDIYRERLSRFEHLDLRGPGTAKGADKDAARSRTDRKR